MTRKIKELAVIVSQEEAAYRYGYQLGLKDWHKHNNYDYGETLRRYSQAGLLRDFQAGYKDGCTWAHGTYSDMLKTRG